MSNDSAMQLLRPNFQIETGKRKRNNSFRSIAITYNVNRENRNTSIRFNQKVKHEADRKNYVL